MRVAIWGSGDVGHYAIRGVISHPDLDLVALRVTTPEKVGRDPGELIGWDPVGVAATDSTEEVLATGIDALVYAGRSRTWEPVLPFLEAGVDVAYLGVTGLLDPLSLDDDIREPVEQAALAGGASILYGGIDPGWSTTVLPLALTAISERVDLLTLYEVRDYDPLPPHQLDYFGFGRADTSAAGKFQPGALVRTWGSSVRGLARALGHALDDIVEFHETQLASEAFDIPARHIAAGTIAAVRFGLSGIIGGVERIRVEHVNRLRRDLAPDWQLEQGYGVRIEGQPNYELHLSLSDPAGRQDRPALWGTAMYGVNALPALHGAPPGIVTPFDLPLFGARNVGGRHQDDNWVISRRVIAEGEQR